jgi:hypothetical protein
MTAPLATLLYAALILGLFWLDRGRREHTSPALWLAVIWVSLACSRSAAEWLHYTPPAPSADLLIEGDPINRVVYSCLVAGALLVLSLRWARVIALLQANGLVVAFLLYCVLSLTWADYPDVGFKRWVKAAGDFLMVLIVVSDPAPSVAIRRLLTRVGFVLIPLSVLMIKYYPDISRYYDVWDWSTYYSGVTTNKNSLGVICLIFGLTSVWRFLAALKMVVWLFRLANSMTALSCFLLGIVVLLVLQFRPVLRQPLLAHALTVSLIAVPSAVLFGGLNPGVLEMMGRNPTLTDRTLIWDLLLRITTDTWSGTVPMGLNPGEWIGTGFENFWLGQRLIRVWSVYKWGPNQAHNGYLEVFLNLGWIGIAMVGAILLVGYRTVMARLRHSPSTGKLMLAFFVVGIVYNFTEAALFRIMAPAWFVLLLAITRVPDLPDAEPQPTSRSTALRMARRFRWSKGSVPLLSGTASG